MRNAPIAGRPPCCGSAPDSSGCCPYIRYGPFTDRGTSNLVPQHPQGAGRRGVDHRGCWRRQLAAFAVQLKGACGRLFFAGLPAAWDVQAAPLLLVWHAGLPRGGETMFRFIALSIGQVALSVFVASAAFAA